jgi:hypothetical protein
MLRKILVLGVNNQHAILHLDFDTEDTLPKQYVPDGIVNKVDGGLTGVDHETVGEFHRFSTGSTKLARHDDFATLGTRLHDESEDTIAGSGIS